MQETRYLVTSALPYINGVKHLGNLIGSMLPADVYVRYLRALGRPALFICATDEHGTPAELAAQEAGMDVSDYCTTQHHIQAELAREFLLSFDHFGRSSSRQNYELTQYFGDLLDKNGYIEERVTKQVYSRADGRFLPDRYVVGTCPNCGYEQARGDQCESCTKLLDPTDLINPRSAVSGSTDLEIRESRHLFFLQSRLVPQLREWIESKEGSWPVLATSIALKWLNEGVQDRSITRDLKWGVPVNRPGFEDKVYYVWFDAPIAYIAATREWADVEPESRDWRSWWFDADDVHYVQFMAKDNVPFHTIGFPATLIGSGEPWKLVDYIKAFNWLDYYGRKFSTSQHVGVFMSDAIKLLPADYWRYYLVSVAPENDDSTFTWESLAEAVNKDLADTLGNFVNRTLKFTERTFGTNVPPMSPEEPERQLEADLDVAVKAYSNHLERMEFRKAAQQLRAIWARGNAYLNLEEPWRAVKTHRERAATVMGTAVNLVRIFASLSSPIIPQTAERILEALGLPTGPSWTSGPMSAELAALPPGHAFTVPPVLFTKIEPQQLNEWKERFGGR